MGQNAVKLRTRPDRISRVGDRQLRPEVLRPFSADTISTPHVCTCANARDEAVNFLSKAIFVPSQTGCRQDYRNPHDAERMILVIGFVRNYGVVNIP